MRKKVLVKFRYMPSIFENNQVYSEVYAKKSVPKFQVYAKYIRKQPGIFGGICEKKCRYIHSICEVYLTECRYIYQLMNPAKRAPNPQNRKLRV